MAGQECKIAPKRVYILSEKQSAVQAVLLCHEQRLIIINLHLTIRSARSIYQLMILPVFYYYNNITLDLSESFAQELRNFEDRASRIIYAYVDLKIPSVLRMRDKMHVYLPSIV